MAIKLNFFLNGKRIKEPLNYQDTSLELNFDKGDPSYSGQVSTNSWTFGVGDNQDNEDGVEDLKAYALGGLSNAVTIAGVTVGGTAGVFGGVSYKIQLEDGGDNPFIYDGYIDLSQGKFTCHQIEAPSNDAKGVDWLTENADSFTFEKLYDDKIITSNDFALIPFQEFKPGDRIQGVLIILTIVTIAFQIWVFVKNLINVINSFIFSKGWDWPRIREIIDTLLALIQLIINIYIFVNQVSRYLLNPVKYKAGMYLHDLCRIGAEHLGYTFESPILDGTLSEYRLTTNTSSIGFNNVVLIPESYTQEEDNEDGTLGITDVRDIAKLKGFYRGTFGDLLRELKTMFNAKIVISNGVLKLDRIDKPQSTNLYQIPNVDRYNTPYRYNVEDLFSKNVISFKKDDQDKVSLQNYSGTEYQVFTNPLLKADNHLQPGERLSLVNYGLTVIKTELTKQEKYLKNINSSWYAIINIPFFIIRYLVRIVNAFVDGINALLDTLDFLGLVNGSIQLNYVNVNGLRNPLQEYRDYFDNQRLGVLQFESDFISLPKLVAVSDSVQIFRSSGGVKNTQRGYKPSLSQRDLLNSKFLYEKFHYVSNFIEDPDLPPFHNQHLIYELNDIPFCKDDYDKVKDDNNILDSDGVTKGEIISLKWNIYRGSADITFKVKEKYTNNLEIQKILSDGK